MAKFSKCLSEIPKTSRKRCRKNQFGIKTETRSDKSDESLIPASDTNMPQFDAGASTFDALDRSENQVDSSPFSYHAGIDFSSLRCFPSPPLSLLPSNPSLTRHLGLDLVPRKEFEMVDPDQISISELYKLVSRAR